MDLLFASLILFFAFIADILIGDPSYKYHPVCLIGDLVQFLFNQTKKKGLKGRITGVHIALISILFPLCIYSALHFIFLEIHILIVIIFDLFVCYSFLALKDLADHIAPVRSAIKSGDLASAQRAVGMVVGRDVTRLDEKGVIRASIETVSENFVDGFLSPVFWFVLGSIIGMFTGVSPLFTGISLLIIFKTASTLDSMLGYKTKEFKDTGWAGARLDDIMNFIPARLSIIVLSAGSLLCRLSVSDGLRVALRDRLKHESPNSAHSESFVAGALGVRLGGPTIYPEGLKEKPWLGGEFIDPELFHLDQALKLIRCSAWITAILCTLLLGGFSAVM